MRRATKQENDKNERVSFRRHWFNGGDGFFFPFSLTVNLFLVLLFQQQKKPSKLTYSTFIAGLKEENIALNRKILSDFAEKEPLTFGALARRVLEKKQRAASASASASAKP